MNVPARCLKSVVYWLGGATFFLVAIFNAFSVIVAYPYYKVEVGMTDKQVIEIFGESYPLINRALRPSLCDAKVWLGDCNAAQNSSATYFLTFKIYFDTYAIIGLKDNKVVYKAIGDA